jgi:hypothetical protein
VIINDTRRYLQQTSAPYIPALDFITQMLSKHSVQGAEATGSLDVSNDADDDHGGCLQAADQRMSSMHAGLLRKSVRHLDDCHSLAGLLLVQLGARLLDLTKDVG